MFIDTMDGEKLNFKASGEVHSMADGHDGQVFVHAAWLIASWKREFPSKYHRYLRLLEGRLGLPNFSEAFQTQPPKTFNWVSYDQMSFR